MLIDLIHSNVSVRTWTTADEPEQYFSAQPMLTSSRLFEKFNEPPLFATPPHHGNQLDSVWEDQKIDQHNPDTSEEMKAAWEAWRKRVSEELFWRFTEVSRFEFKNSTPMLAQVRYTVDDAGKIDNVKLVKKSWSPQFNSLVLSVIDSIGDDPILKFPAGSERQTVEKTDIFSANYGAEGIKCYGVERMR